ncbi:cupin-like domain-containing protein [Flavobacterium amniphilum]|uniref:cupin-like domain-containing protein n=1 Tax=Flavobacterium amniphilum TaxID=1834035 RepID=UPI00202A785C|nr:cupin-like domain-containing protein [Flavobacterium amniphilum]MCL9805391.1 cupin-like domain-containing protein [Flavobacterium amniphilum]
MELKPADIVSSITKEEFIKNYYKPQKPLLIKGFARQWEAYEKWNFEYIKEKVRDQIVPLYDSKPADANKSTSAPVVKMKFNEYINRIQSTPSDLRIFFYIITDRLPELLNNFTYPDLGMKFFKRLPTLFFGGSEAKVLMHYDVGLGDFMHMHFEGRKRILLFDQKQSPFLYKVPFSVHTVYEVDYENPDYEKFPALKYAQGYEIFMEHGDALYIPGAFWHFNRYLDAGFSMSLRVLPNKPLQFANMLYHVFIMRYTDKVMRKLLKKKWVDFKQDWAYKKTHKKLKAHLKQSA